MIPKAILFDAYGTILSTGNGSVHAAKQILDKNRVSMDSAVFYSEWKKLHREQMSHLPYQNERDIFVSDLKILYERYGIFGDYQSDAVFMLQSLLNRKAFPETSACLDSLKQQFQIYVCTNTDTEPLLQNLAYNGLCIHGIFTSEQLECYKPDPKFYQTVLENTGLRPDEAVFIGDSYQDDIAGPKKWGIYSVLIHRNQSPVQVKDSLPDQILSSLPDKDMVVSWF